MRDKISSLGEILLQAVSASPDKTAVTFENREITYRRLKDLSLTLAGQLQKHGIKTGEKVGILLSNRPEYLGCYFAVFLLGAIAVPLNQLLSPAEIEGILHDCAPKAVITEDRFGSMVNDDCLKLDIGELAGKKPDSISFPEIVPESPAVFIYTSGTTGRPKGVMLSHRNLLANIRSSLQACNLSARDRFLLFLPLFHSFSLTVCFLVPCYLRAKIVLIPGLAREKIREGIIKHRVTVFVGIPTIYSLMSTRKLAWWQRWLNPVKVYLSGGAPLPKEVLTVFEKVYRRPLLEGYGLSEASPAVSINPPVGSRPCGSIGLPLPGVSVKIVGEDGLELPRGEVGELLVKGDNVMLGYYNQPEITARTVRDGWLYTGDLGYKDKRGY
ncbi:MAG: AMP-binding protein, partial [bacterium]